MIELKVAELEELGTQLVATGETVRGPRSFSDPKSKISVGRPVIVELRPDQNADLLPPGFAADQAWFGMLRLSISARPATDEWLERVWVSVSLAPSGNDAPILWSMIPDGESSTISIDDTVTLGANLKFLGAKSENKVSREEHLISVTTFGLLQGEGCWELAQIPGKELRGDYVFAAVIRAEEATEIAGVVRYDATVGRRQFGVISARCEVADDGGAGFALKRP